MEQVKKEEEFKNALATAMTKAWGDNVFKQKLIDNPTEAIKSLTGVELSLKKDAKLIISDQSDPMACYINIPVKPDIEDMELNEEQLELVAGGSNPVEEFVAEKVAKLVLWIYNKQNS